MKRIPLENFRDNASRFVARVRRTRESLAITCDGDEVARLVPSKGQFWRRLREFLRSLAGQKRGEHRRASWGVYLKMR